MHTMAPVSQHEDQTVLTCSAHSAEVCGLREFYVQLQPPVSNLGHFHQQAHPPRGSSPDPNTRFPPGTFLLFEGALSFSHNDASMEQMPPSRQHDGVRNGFTLSTEPVRLPEGPWPLHMAPPSQGPTLHAIDPKKPLPCSH